jgi:hypothetical protein
VNATTIVPKIAQIPHAIATITCGLSVNSNDAIADPNIISVQENNQMHISNILSSIFKKLYIGSILFRNDYSFFTIAECEIISGISEVNESMEARLPILPIARHPTVFP